jgi:bacterioferritin-associated ferredoxin
MIVCFCNSLRESQVRAAAAAGHSDVPGCYAALGGHVQCGQCVCFAQSVIDDASNDRGARQLLAAE